MLIIDRTEIAQLLGARRPPPQGEDFWGIKSFKPHAHVWRVNSRAAKVIWTAISGKQVWAYLAICAVSFE